MNTEDSIETKSETGYTLDPFFELSSDLLCIAGFDGYFKKVNPALCKLLKFSKEELLTHPINSFVHPDDQKLTEKHRDTIRGGKPLLNFENRYISKSGEAVWLSWTSIPVDDKKLIYAIAKDVTHRKEHEKERNQLLSELTTTNKQLKQLTYTTSHDLRAPVSNLLAVFNLIDKSTIEDGETLEFLGLLERASKNLKEMLNSYVDTLEQVDTLKIETKPLDIREVLNSVIKSIDSFIQDSNATFNLQLDNFEHITFNRSYLESIFLNLITNSLKYAHPDREPVISIKTEKVNNRKQLIFSDNGQGFDTDEIEGNIFGLHQKFHDHPDSKGIGLYLVYNHITNFGGTISVESEVDVGTTFKLIFRN